MMKHRPALSSVIAVIGAALTIGCRNPEPQMHDSTHATSTTSALPNDIGAIAADTIGPASVLRRYYAAIESGDYDTAYALWGRAGAASGHSREEFAAGFAQTAHVRLTFTDSIRIEGAAGSQYATIAVAVDAVLRNGKEQRFVGGYTLRRAMVDGATPDQRRWHIERAELRPRRPDLLPAVAHRQPR
jgi:hypothetical protein